MNIPLYLGFRPTKSPSDKTKNTDSELAPSNKRQPSSNIKIQKVLQECKNNAVLHGVLMSFDYKLYNS